MGGFFRCLLCISLALLSFRAAACTAVIVSGRVTSDGRPLIWKHRDTDSLDNSLRHFKGEKYSFIGLVNSSSEGGEVWAGINTAGFAVINTASYCLKNDDVPASEMDREGILMYRALEICASLEDFQTYLDTLSRPMGVEANFGCIDAFGGAAWYETDNNSWHKIDVNKCESGYYVVTNFSVTGDPARWKGVERHKVASAIFSEIEAEGALPHLRPLDIVNRLSRSFRDEGLGQTIPRMSTSASVVFHGVRDGGNPREAVVWAALGYPPLAVTVPVPLSVKSHIPSQMSSHPVSGPDSFCGLSLKLKTDFGAGGWGIEECREAEDQIASEFEELYRKFITGKVSYNKYLRKYDSMSEDFFRIYKESFDLIAISGKIH